MKIPYLNHLHQASNFCLGYDNYLEKRKIGIKTSFNWSFFFTTFFWFSYHRMYKELILSLYVYSLLLTLFSKQVLTAYSVILIFFIFYLIGCFYSYYLYEKSMNYKLNLNSENPYKKVKPFNFIISVGIFISLSLACTLTFSFLFRSLI